MSSKDALVKAARRTTELLEKGWCRKHYAINSKGAAECVDSPDAVSFCMAGAAMKACLPEQVAYGDLTDLMLVEISTLGYSGIPEFNDDPKVSKDDVMAVMKSVNRKLNVR